jgi:peptide-methionine (R)-S-oxide reductase
MEKIEKTDEQWRAELDPSAYAVLRHQATEPPFTGKYTFEKTTGTYRCAGCGAEVFQSDSKYDSGCGWPSFTESAHPESVELRSDTSLGMVRTEVVCARCGGHLGHVFDDGPVEAGGQRYCINSVAIELEAQGE